MSNSSDYPVINPGPPTAPHGERMRYGGCSCGAVRFEVRGEPVKVGLCHCTECRKATGAVYVTYADWPRSAFRLSGEAREYRGRSFCPMCGSRVFHLSRDKVEIMVGALDDAPSDLIPTREGWIKRRELWLSPLGNAGQFEEDPVA
jgi:hypothetical protein